MNNETTTGFTLVTKIGKYALTGAAAALISMAGLAPALYAAPSGEASRVVIKYDADQAATQSGALALYNRLDSAAHQVCPTEDSLQPQRARQARQCQREALDRAVTQIHTRRLVEIATARANRG